MNQPQSNTVVLPVAPQAGILPVGPAAQAPVPVVPQQPMSVPVQKATLPVQPPIVPGIPLPVPGQPAVAPIQPGITPEPQQQAAPDNDALLREVQSLKAQIANMPIGQGPQQQQQQQDVTLQERSFIDTDDAFNAVVQERGNFNKTANAISAHAVEHLLKVLPGLINNRVTQSIGVYDATKDFFQKNGDLVAYEQALTREVATLQSARPGMPIQQTLDDAANILRQKLNLPVQQISIPQIGSQVAPVQQGQTVYIPSAPPPVPGANNTGGFQAPPAMVPAGGNNRYADLAAEVADTFGIR